MKYATRVGFVLRMTLEPILCVKNLEKGLHPTPNEPESAVAIVTWLHAGRKEKLGSMCSRSRDFSLCRRFLIILVAHTASYPAGDSDICLVVNQPFAFYL